MHGLPTSQRSSDRPPTQTRGGGGREGGEAVRDVERLRVCARARISVYIMCHEPYSDSYAAAAAARLARLASGQM